MRNADWIAQRLKSETDVVFGVTGGCIVNQVDAFHKAGFTIIMAHHEQGAAMMADGYARATGKLGVCFATSGPGGENLLTGLGCSYYDSVATLAIVGQVPTAHKRRVKGLRQFGFQETDNADILRHNCVDSIEIERTEDLRRLVDEAMTATRRHRKGPVVIEIPDDIQRAEFSSNGIELGHPFDDITADGDTVQSAMNLICKAERPVLVIGAGADREDVEGLARALNWPILLTWGAMDYLDDEDYLNMRDFGITSQRAGNFILEAADLIVAIGTRLDTHEFACSESLQQKTICVDIDEFELSKARYMLPVHASSAVFCRDVLEWIEVGKPDRPDCDNWLNRCRTVKASYPICTTYDQQNPYRAIRNISHGAPSDAIIVTDAGQTVTWTFQSWQIKKGQRLFTAFNHSPMGYALPAAIGAAIGCPARSVYCIIGDGGLMMNVQELATASRYCPNLKIYVLDNKGYGMIRQTQNDWDGLDKDIATQPRMPDWYHLQKAFDIELTVVSIHADAKIEPKLKAGSEVWDQSPKLAPEEVGRIRATLRG